MTQLRADLGLGHVRIDQEVDAGLPHISKNYGESGGSSALREAVAQWENVNADEVAITTGASLGLAAIFATLERPCSILCPKPHYPQYPLLAAMFGIEVILYDLHSEDGWQPDPDQVATLVRQDTRALLVNFPGNPAGNIACLRRLEHLSNTVDKHRLIVISDEVYSHFIYDEAPRVDIVPLFGLNATVRLLSFSKMFCMPGERLGYIVAAPTRVNSIAHAHWILAMSPPATAQVLALNALRSSAAVRIADLRRKAASNRDSAYKILSQYDRLTCLLPAAGIFCWIEVSNCSLDSHSLARACAAKAGVLVSPGSVFGINRPVYVRASFAVPAVELTTGFQALSEFLSAV